VHAARLFVCLSAFAIIMIPDCPTSYAGNVAPRGHAALPLVDKGGGHDLGRPLRDRLSLFVCASGLCVVSQESTQIPTCCGPRFRLGWLHVRCDRMRGLAYKYDGDWNKAVGQSALKLDRGRKHRYVSDPPSWTYTDRTTREMTWRRRVSIETPMMHHGCQVLCRPMEGHIMSWSRF
jgi:hypothetical protein